MAEHYITGENYEKGAEYCRLAAGQAMLAIYQGTAFDASYVLSAVALLIISVVMLRSNIFSKVTAYVGILMGVLTLVPSTAGTIGLTLALISLVPTAIWLILIAQRFFQLGLASRSRWKSS